MGAEERMEIQKKKVEEWNKLYDRGQRVLVRPDGKEEYEAMAVTQAYMFYGLAVVLLDNDNEVLLPTISPVDTLRGKKDCLYCKASLAEPFPFETDKGEAVCDDCGRERNMH